MKFQPTVKSQSIEELLNHMFNRTAKIESSKCATCESENLTFRDELSEKEYTISGMCQTCQDDFFGI